MPVHNFIDLTGKTFGSWRVVERADNYRTDQGQWLCMCECGNSRVVLTNSLIRGKSKSCGCYRGRLLAARKTKHGQHNSPEYSSWRGAKERCFNPRHNHWKLYGAMGVTMCDKWANDFAEFLRDMGPRPKGRSLDRYPDPYGNYEPDNCRWATAKEQRANRRH